MRVHRRHALRHDASVSDAATAARHVEGIDPYALLEVEQARAVDFLRGLDADGWLVPTACPGWRRREMAAHLAGGEDYNRSTMDGTRQAFVAEGVAAGAHDLDSFNDWGVRRRAERSAAAVLDELREKCATTLHDIRARDGSDLDTMAGPYPARLQAFHLAFESAIHNDDMDVPVDSAECAARDRWRAATARFFVDEYKRPIEVERVDGGTRVRHSTTGDEVVLDDADMVRACSGRLRERAAGYPQAIVEALRPEG
jgi:uncharacterized protein (TIGR03083 family)